jgi:16S rRNA (guanine527-N7)-methyltransferase
MRAAPPEAFREQARALGLAFDDGDLERIGRYLELLLAANARFNLTRIDDPEEAWTKHVLDSLTLLPYLVEAGAARVIDVGSGGGLPGVPLAVTLPSTRFTLLEATGKKARFLEETAAALGLENVTVISERAETLAHDRDHRAAYDAIVCRAVGRMPVLLELTVPLAREGGHVLAIKGGRAVEEVASAKQALHHLHAAVVDQAKTPTGTIVVIEKLRATPKKYPRRPGEPKRAPLG